MSEYKVAKNTGARGISYHKTLENAIKTLKTLKGKHYSIYAGYDSPNGKIWLRIEDEYIK